MRDALRALFADLSDLRADARDAFEPVGTNVGRRIGRARIALRKLCRANAADAAQRIGASGFAAACIPFGGYFDANILAACVIAAAVGVGVACFAQICRRFAFAVNANLIFGALRAVGARCVFGCGCAVVVAACACACADCAQK